MKIFLYLLFFLSILQYGFAENIRPSHMNTTQGIPMNDTKYSVGVSFTWVRQENSQSIYMRANSGRNMEYNSTNIGGASSLTGQLSNGLSGENLMMKKNLPQTSMEENFIIFLAVIFLSLILFRIYRKNVL